MKDELGDRIKRNYENRTRIYLPRRTYTIIRVDGKCFGNFTKNLNCPFDAGLMADMDATAEYLCKNIQGAKIGFVQSDEISILMTDFDTLTTDAWFDGNIQKIVSVASSMATSKFNQLRTIRHFTTKFGSVEPKKVNFSFSEELYQIRLAEFDARTFTIPSKTEVMNYFIWRQADTVRNSISSVAQSLYSSKELHGKNMSVQQDMIHEKGQNWNDFTMQEKRGRFVYKQEYEIKSELKDSGSVKRSKWITVGCPTFTQEPDFLDGFIPEMD